MVGFCYPLCHCPGQLRSYCSCAACAKVWGSNFMVSMFLDCPSKQNWGKGIEMIEWVCVARHVGLMLTLWHAMSGWCWLCGVGLLFVGLLFVKVICVMFPPSQCLSLDSADCPKHLLGKLLVENWKSHCCIIAFNQLISSTCIDAWHCAF